MVRQRRAPGVQHQGGADLGAQMPPIGGNGAQGFGSDVKQQAVQHGLVGIGNRADWGRQGEHHMVIVHRQQLGLTGFEPASRGACLALRTMPVAAGIVGNLDLLAGVAAQHMAAQCRSAALFNGRHDLALAQAQMSMLGLTPGRPVGAENIRDLQTRRSHGRDLRGTHSLQRTDDFPQNVGGDLGIKRRGLELLVPEQDLDHADIHLLLQQVRRKTVA